MDAHSLLGRPDPVQHREDQDRPLQQHVLLPLTYLAAVQLERIWERREQFGWSRYAVGILGLLFASITLAVPFIGMNIDVLKPFLQQDPFALANMDAEVHWSRRASIVGIVLLSALILGHLLHRQGKYRASLISVLVEQQCSCG